MPLLTVALPVYNAMPYLPHAVASILSQRGCDFQLLIIDDGSTDGSAVFMDSIRDARVTIIHQSNQGLAATLNRSLALCQTELYARMDADDISLPYRLAGQVSYLTTHQDVVLVGSQIEFILGDRVYPGSLVPVDHESILQRTLRGEVAVCHPSIMVRIEAARKAGGYRLLGEGQDFDFFLCMSEVGRLANLCEVRHRYRMHMKSVVATRYSALCRNRAWAIERYRCRQAGSPEPSQEEFALQWSSRSHWSKATTAIDCWSGLQYRRALMEFAGGRRFVGGMRMAVAAACRPRAVVRQLKDKTRWTL